MAGLYIHIPFCRQQCHYCDFHFTVSFRQKERVIAAITEEIKTRSNETESISYQSIYFGGGTPSILAPDEIQDLFSVLYQYYKVDTSAEITFEANPDDLNPVFLRLLKSDTPVNRLSIGIQSFIDRDLHFMNRLHTSEEAIKSVEDAVSAGFTNINADLIYGIPTASNKDWNHNLALIKKLNIPHLSAYYLTIEPNTVFAYYRKKGMIKEVPEDKSVKQFKTLMEFADKAGFDHYEISNLARPGFYSRHNMGYWTQKPYLGFGPSAHSYNGRKRRWNVANNTRYLQSMENHTNDYFETENIDEAKAYNEYIMTSLRTMWGIDLNYLEKQFGPDRCLYFLQMMKRFADHGELIQKDGKVCLSREGKMIADYVISELMCYKD